MLIQYSFIEVCKEPSFFTHRASSLALESTSSRLSAGDYYFINLSTQKAGYLSLFLVYEDSSTGVLLENEKVGPRAHIEFPDKKKYDGIEVLLNKGKYTYDTNIALLCPNRIDTSRFEKT
ncbi:MAG: hypothetical protein GYB23_03555 [Vibrionaceae bacterium]|nr:hypothetical protein [Vibrionaceae bacterium]